MENNKSTYKTSFILVILIANDKVNFTLSFAAPDLRRLWRHILNKSVRILPEAL